MWPVWLAVGCVTAPVVGLFLLFGVASALTAWNVKRVGDARAGQSAPSADFDPAGSSDPASIEGNPEAEIAFIDSQEDRCWGAVRLLVPKDPRTLEMTVEPDPPLVDPNGFQPTVPANPIIVTLMPKPDAAGILTFGISLPYEDTPGRIHLLEHLDGGGVREVPFRTTTPASRGHRGL